MKALEYGIRDVTINILNRIKDRGGLGNRTDCLFMMSGMEAGKWSCSDDFVD